MKEGSKTTKEIVFQKRNLIDLQFTIVLFLTTDS